MALRTVRLERDWVDPLAVAAGLRDRDGLCALLSGGEDGGRSFVMAEPDQVVQGAVEGEALFEALRAPGWSRGVVGLMSYDAGARAATGMREPAEPGGWPDLMLARYPAMLEFDPAARRVTAVGLGDDAAEAGRAAEKAAGWLASATVVERPEAPATDFTPEAPDAAYLAGVAQIIDRIGEGELFQANLARAWTGALQGGAEPFDVLLRLSDRGAAFGGYWRLGDRAVVSNSPELFVSLDAETGRIESRPIKGTRPRQPTPEADAAMARALGDSAKDRAENLMIVDLMRNDLARAARPGSVKVERLFGIETLPTVHHLVSTVSGALAEGAEAADLLEATFPPGSITGAPKHQAMKVIAGLEPSRGPWCGSLFVLDAAGGLASSVLIRTAAFVRDEGRWRFRTLAGAGIVADSDPCSELEETDAKISALRAALIG